MHCLQYDGFRGLKTLTGARVCSTLGLVAALSALLGCGYYDPGLLAVSQLCGNGQLDPGEICDPSIAAGMDGACPDTCDSDDRCAPVVLVGDGCQRRCVAQATKALDGDGCCPAGMSAAMDRDCSTCGDGVVEAGETCDPPESCLNETTCVSPSPCVTAKLSGDPSTCNTRCELTPTVSCQSGDGCCPAGCAQNNDHDCSASCGDGIVDARTETCEPDSETQPCTADCDDKDPCTIDFIVGSLQNCNLDCMHVTTTTARNGDRCCPRGATSLNDDDCEPVCGNGLRERGEDCDGGPDCDEHCRAPALQMCRAALSSVDSMSAACKQCACERCGTRVMNCYSSGDQRADAACQSVTECTNRTGCEGGSCYCGSSLSCNTPNGSCRREIETAVGSVLPSAVLVCAGNADCPVARAYAHDACLQRNCQDTCTLNSP